MFVNFLFVLVMNDKNKINCIIAERVEMHVLGFSILDINFL